MKRLLKTKHLLALLPVVAPLNLIHGQGFLDLNFEAATVPQTQPPGSVGVSNALPGWTVTYGGIQATQVLFNDATLGTTSVSLIGTNGIGTTKSIEGGFSVLLQGGVTATDASISQTGLVPGSAESIRFKAQPGFGSLEAFLGGQNIPLFALGTGPDYTLYGGDVTGFAGLPELLEFSALNAQSLGRNDWNIDSIVFSPQPIPEPSVFGLTALGGLLFAWHRWKARAN